MIARRRLRIAPGPQIPSTVVCADVPSVHLIKLTQPLPNTMLRIVASGEREDPPSQAAQAQPSLPL